MEKNDIVDKDILKETSGARTYGKHSIYCLTIVGQIEGHTELPSETKTTKYEAVIPLLAAIEEDKTIGGLLILLNTVGGDVEAGLAIAELIAGMSKPTASLVLGGGHSIGIPLAVSANRSFIAKTATMTVHPVRHNGMIVGIPQTMRHFDRIQDRITSFICDNSGISAAGYKRLLDNTAELVTDVGTVLCGEQAVKKGIIDECGTLSDALKYLYERIEDRKTAKKGMKKQ